MFSPARVPPKLIYSEHTLDNALSALSTIGRSSSML